jgi:CHC2 zinc finger
MDGEFLSKTEEQEWVSRRVSEVNSVYSVFQILSDRGFEIPDLNTSFQILCPFHGDRNKPSARYYAPSGRNPGHFYCFKCKLRLDSVSLYARFNNKKFYEALGELERRFGIRVPKRPESVGINPSERGSDYKSIAWDDIPRHLEILESKLLRSRPKATMAEYIKVCRLLDNVRYDFNAIGEKNSHMSEALSKASEFIDSYVNVSSDLD